MIRKALLKDAKLMQRLINNYSDDKVMLPRSLGYIYETIREFNVFVDDDNNLLGCIASHIVWDDLAEIKALAVSKQHLKKGIGKSLVEKAILDAKLLGAKRIFALTYVNKFFEKLGFKVINRNSLPQKIWTECIHCPKFPECDEIAVEKYI